MRIAFRIVLFLTGLWTGLFVWAMFGFEALNNCERDLGGCSSSLEQALNVAFAVLPGLLSALIPDRWSRTAFGVRLLSSLFFGVLSYAVLVGRESYWGFPWLISFTILGVLLYRQIRQFLRKGASIKAVQAGIPETPAACSSPEA